MRLRRPLVYLPVIIFILSSCLFENRIRPSREIIEFEIPVSELKAISASDVYKINIVKADTESVNIRCNANLKEYLNTYQKGNTLHLNMEHFSASDVIAEVQIMVKDLNKISCSGAAELFVQTGFYPNLSFDLSGATKVKVISINANELAIESSGASSIKISGETKILTSSSSGASKMKGKKLVAEDVFINGSGASQSSITSNGKLNINLSGASKLTYYGSPKTIQKSTSGASEIIQK